MDVTEFSKGPWAKRWSLLESLGRGGQSSAMKVVEISDASSFGTLKVLKKPKDRQARMRMNREMAILKTLGHPAIPRVLDSNHEEYAANATLFAVLQFIDGRTLNEFIHSSPMSIADAITMQIKLIELLEYLRVDVPIFHRDIKPQNIILRADVPNDPVLIDFGIAATIDDEEELTRQGEYIGNRFLQLPEFKNSKNDKRDFRSDLTSCCGILYFCLTGEVPEQLIDNFDKKPHERDAGSAYISSLPVHTGKILKQIFGLGFNNSVDQRFQSIKAYLDQIKNLESSLTQEVQTVSPTQIERINELSLKVGGAGGLHREKDALRNCLSLMREAANNVASSLAGFSYTQYGPEDQALEFIEVFGFPHRYFKAEAKVFLSCRLAGAEIIVSQVEQLSRQSPIVRTEIARVPYTVLVDSKIEESLTDAVSAYMYDQIEYFCRQAECNNWE